MNAIPLYPMQSHEMSDCKKRYHVSVDIIINQPRRVLWLKENQDSPEVGRPMRSIYPDHPHNFIDRDDTVCYYYVYMTV